MRAERLEDGGGHGVVGEHGGPGQQGQQTPRLLPEVVQRARSGRRVDQDHEAGPRRPPRPGGRLPRGHELGGAGDD
ncbi:hypothetical protein ACH4ZU_08030 [Streptomyces sp. NPDC020472]|uniref:hypothetical protein n=1 Tax=Streptomyces sp. NPDC020472 TaxID=3365075 RepID=UPI0037936C48